MSVKFHFRYYRRERQKKYKTKVLFLHYSAIYEGIVDVLAFYYGVIWGKRPAHKDFSIHQIA